MKLHHDGSNGYALKRQLSSVEAVGQNCLDLLNELLRVVWPFAVRTELAQLRRGVRSALGNGGEDDFGFRQICLHPTGEPESAFRIAKHEPDGFGGFLQESDRLWGALRASSTRYPHERK
jgi:hypothetical protein